MGGDCGRPATSYAPRGSRWRSRGTKSDFDAKMAAFAKAVADHKDKAKTLDELKAAMPFVSKTCGDCHEPYRRPGPAGQKEEPTQGAGGSELRVRCIRARPGIIESIERRFSLRRAISQSSME